MKPEVVLAQVFYAEPLERDKLMITRINEYIHDCDRYKLLRSTWCAVDRAPFQMDRLVRESYHVLSKPGFCRDRAIGDGAAGLSPALVRRARRKKNPGTKNVHHPAACDPNSL